MTITLTPEQAQELAAVASLSQQTPESLAAEILTEALQREKESRALLLQADADVAAGRLLTHEDVWARLEARFGWK